MEPEQPEKPQVQNEGQKEGWERALLEKLAFASLEESRKARRWGIFFKLFFAVYLVVVLLITQSASWSEKALASHYTAVVTLEGEISSESSANAESIIKGLHDAFEDKAAVGVILQANSPGGSPVQSAYIYDEIVRLREKFPDKPLYAVIGDICASGCYYAVAAADKIYASPASIVGSIGVLMDGFGFVDGLKKLGIERRLLTAGKNKGLLDPFSPLDAKARRHAQGMLDEIHEQFIEAVKQGRGATLKPSSDLFSGLFWTGAKAKDLGLVDDFGSTDSVARDVIGAEEIVDYSVRENLLHRLVGRLGMSMGKAMATELHLSGSGLR